MTLRFIHAADLHLDSPLAGLSSHSTGEDAAEGAAFIRSASRRALEALVDRAIAEKVAFVLLAGDLWDGDAVDVGTGLFFQREMRRLREAGIAAFAILGNHDAESQITTTRGLLDDVRLLSRERAETVRPEGIPVAIHGRSFPAPAVEENLALSYPDAVPGVANVAMLHTGLDGRPGHSPYAPCTVADLKAKGYDYWALGHIHARDVVAESAAPGDGGTIAWSGVLQGRHVRETGPKGAFLVEIGDGPPRVAPIDLDVVRWLRIAVDLSGAEDPGEAETMLRAPIANAAAAAGGARLVAARVVAHGTTPLAGTLDFTREWLREKVAYAAASAGLEPLFLEKVELRTEAPAPPAPAGETTASDVVGDLLAEAARDPALAEEVARHLREVFQTAPAEVRPILAELEPALHAGAEGGDVAPVLGRAAAMARAGLLSRD